MQSQAIETIVWGRLLFIVIAILFAIVAAVRISLARKTAWPLVLLGALGMFALLGIFVVRTSYVPAPPQYVGSGPVQIYTDGSPLPPMAPMAPQGPMAPMGPGGSDMMKMPGDVHAMQGPWNNVSIGHPQENTVNLVADPSAWRPEVEELYRANLYSSATSASRSLGQRLRQQLAKMAESERPKRVYVVTPAGSASVGTTATVQLAANEIARQLRQLDQLDVQLTDSAKTVREEWAAAASSPAPAAQVPSNTGSSNDIPSSDAADSPDVAKSSVATESSDAADSPDAGGEPVTPAPPAPTAPDGEPSSSSESAVASLTAESESEGESIGANANVAEPAEISQPADVGSLASEFSEKVSAENASAEAGGGAVDGSESRAEQSPPAGVVARVPYLVEIDLVDFTVQTPGNWGMDWTSQGALRASLESPGTLYDQQVRFYDKPWVDREDEFVARNPRGNFVVVRSELMVSPEEARLQNQRRLGDYLYQRLMSANQLNPGLIQPHQLIECEALQSLIEDRFVQQLDGPGGEPVWREALLVRAGAPGEPNALTQWVQERQREQQVVEHHERVRRRSVGAQMVVLLGGIAGLYTMLNAATQGYFTGRLRAVAVVAVVLALLGFLMIG